MSTRHLKRTLFIAGFPALLLAVMIGSVAAMQPRAESPAEAPKVAAGAPQQAALTGLREGGGEEGEEEEDWDHPDERDDWFYARRTAGDPDYSIAEAAVMRAEAAEAVLKMKNAPTSRLQGLHVFSGAWEGVGPSPIRQAWGAGILAMSGRVGALAVRSSPPHTIFLGGAQGGIWISSDLTSEWIPKTDQLASLAIGAVELAPSNEDVVYVGTGEGALSGDSYYGNGVLKSIDGGSTFNHVSGNAFMQVSVSRIAVDPTNANHLYIATLRGRGGSRRVTPPNPTPYGIFESTDGGVNWTARITTTNQANGATDLVMDPQDPKVLYASFLSQNIRKSVDGGLSWAPIMNGLPADTTYAGTRFALGISHPPGTSSAMLYTGFNYTDNNGTGHPGTVWRSTDGGGTWTETSTAVVSGYCGGQCSYDNVVTADPKNANIAYALGQYDYGSQSGGIYRTMDGGVNWVDIGYAQHPDYHALAIRRDAPENIVVGNDGGVWRSSTRGGRLAPTDPVSANDWSNLNGKVDPVTGAVHGAFNLQIAQFTGIAQHPTRPDRLYGGTQDNGTQVKHDDSHAWADKAGGDGGFVLVDPVNPKYVYNTEYGIRLFRFENGMQGSFGSKIAITSGITTSDRAEFYIPWVLDPDFTSRLYMGTYRVYRTDDHGDNWVAISGDLTSGCRGTAPNGGRGCVISALGATAGASALYAGTEEGWINLSTNTTDAKPTWARVDKPPLPGRPVQSFAVDRSDYRVAYVSFGGFSAATPTLPGHVFKTTDGGQTWTDATGNLPDVPVNSIVLDATDPNTLYAGTDVGPMVSHNGGQSWEPLGSGFPIVTVHQLDLNPFTRQILAGTHGRGAWRLRDAAASLPALRVRASEPGIPVGPGSLLTYTLKVRNIGNGAATGVTARDPIPANTSFVSSPNGTLTGNEVVWNNLTVPVSGTVSVAFTVRIATTPGVSTGTVITNDGISVTSTQGAGAKGSPLSVTLAAPYALRLDPARQLDGTRVGQDITYLVTVENRGYNADAYIPSVSGNQWPTTLWDEHFGAQLTRTATLRPGRSQTFGVKVSVPALAADGATDLAVIDAASAGSPTVHASAEIRTLAVVKDILLVDEDGNGPDVRSYYMEAITGSGHVADVWDLTASPALPPRYLMAHRTAVWFTGASYPGPLIRYEPTLAAFLDGGGRLFMSGWDILDQAAGETEFVHRYLHIEWEDDRDNDVEMPEVTGVVTNPLTSDLGTIPLDKTVLADCDCSDELELVAPARPAFWGENQRPTALSVQAGAYRVVFLAFPFEALTVAAKRNTFMGRVLDWLAEPIRWDVFLPLTLDNQAFGP